MNRAEHLMTIAAEEAAEVAQRLSKSLRFGVDEVQPGQGLTNGQRVSQEFAELMGVMEMLGHEGLIAWPISSAAMAHKQEKVEQFLQYSALCGTLREAS